MARAKLEVFGDSSVRLAGFAKALAHPARIDILRHLAVSGEQPCMEVVGRLPLSQPTCSRHINELLRAGLLKSRTVRTQILFRVDHKALEGFCAAMNRTLHPQPKRQSQPPKP
jgi:ArsR family transcriptional regulator, arsenate/arsenite/antimonite-responsive transcriptional repressor